MPQLIRTLKTLQHRLLALKLHKVIFGIITIVFVCLTRHILLIGPLDLTENIYIGVICLFSRLLLLDSLKNYLDEFELNIDLGNIIWGRNYMGGGENNNIVFIKNKQIKLTDKTYMVDKNNQNVGVIKSNTGNTAGQNISIYPPSRTNSPVGTNTNTTSGPISVPPSPNQNVAPNSQDIPYVMPMPWIPTPSPYLDFPPRINYTPIITTPSPYGNLPPRIIYRPWVSTPSPYQGSAPIPENTPGIPIPWIPPASPYADSTNPRPSPSQDLASDPNLPLYSSVPPSNPQNLPQQANVPTNTFKPNKS